jgi:hypothetical protein
VCLLIDRIKKVSPTGRRYPTVHPISHGEEKAATGSRGPPPLAPGGWIRLARSRRNKGGLVLLAGNENRVAFVRPSKSDGVPCSLLPSLSLLPRSVGTYRWVPCRAIADSNLPVSLSLSLSLLSRMGPVSMEVHQGTSVWRALFVADNSAGSSPHSPGKSTRAAGILTCFGSTPGKRYRQGRSGPSTNTTRGETEKEEEEEERDDVFPSRDDGRVVSVPHTQVGVGCSPARSLARFERSREPRRRKLGCALPRRSGRVTPRPLLFCARREMGNPPSSLEIGRLPRSTADAAHRNTPTPPRFVTRPYFYSSILYSLCTAAWSSRIIVLPSLRIPSPRRMGTGPGHEHISPRGRCAEKRRAREGEIHPALAVSAMLARASNGGSGSRCEGLRRGRPRITRYVSSRSSPRRRGENRPQPRICQAMHSIRDQRPRNSSISESATSTSPLVLTPKARHSKCGRRASPTKA